MGMHGVEQNRCRMRIRMMIHIDCILARRGDERLHRKADQEDLRDEDRHDQQDPQGHIMINFHRLSRQKSRPLSLHVLYN